MSIPHETPPESLHVFIPTCGEPHLAKAVESVVWQPEVASVTVANNRPAEQIGNLPGREQGLVHVIPVQARGIGHAARAGAEAAMERGATIIGRLDADTEADHDWGHGILDHFAAHPEHQIIYGPSRPLHDEHYRLYDSVAWPIFTRALRRAAQFRYRDQPFSAMLPRTASGYSMAIRKDAYEQAGGFPAQGNDAAVHDDLALSLGVGFTFGVEALGYAKAMKAATSVRDVRYTGQPPLLDYVRLGEWYITDDMERRAQIMQKPSRD